MSKSILKQNIILFIFLQTLKAKLIQKKSKQRLLKSIFGSFVKKEFLNAILQNDWQS